MNWLSRAREAYHNLFNAKFAVLSAIFNGGFIVVMNWSHGIGVAGAAGGAQAVSSFLSTGITARLVQHFSPIKNPFQAYLLGSVIPATLTFGMSFGAHLLNGTVNPVMNTVPATTISFVTSFVTNFIARHGYLRPPNYPDERT